MVSRRDAETFQTHVILNLVQDDGSVTAYWADERLHPVMLKQVQHDEEGDGFTRRRGDAEVAILPFRGRWRPEGLTEGVPGACCFRQYRT